MPSACIHLEIGFCIEQFDLVGKLVRTNIAVLLTLSKGVGQPAVWGQSHVKKIDANLWMPVKAFWQHVNGITRLFNGKIV